MAVAFVSDNTESGLINTLFPVIRQALGCLAQTYGLPAVMFWMVIVPYLINAVYWFLFYRFYRRDVAAQQARSAKV